MKKILLIIRGAPGSGKSTIARAMIASGYFRHHFEADMYFTSPTGSYSYNPAKVPEAHRYCRCKTEDAMASNSGNIIVSNTSTKTTFLQPYYDMAEQYGYIVQEMILPYPIFNSEHYVPNETVEKMQNQLLTSLIQEFQSPKK